MELVVLFFTGILIGISGDMIPGPLTLFTFSEALKTNKFAGLKIISGHILLEWILIGVTLLGFNRFLGSERVLLVVSVVGGVALVIMGIILLVNSGKMKLSDAKADSGFGKGLFIGGMFLTIASPGFIVWWLTIGVSTIVKALLSGVMGVIVLTLGHHLADTLWYGFLSYAVDKGKRYLTDKTYQNIMRFFSILLIGLGGYFIF